MIPKLIHYVWLGNNPLPDKMQQCIASWKHHMPDYEIMVWDDERIKEIDSMFMREALAERKWAFASDVVRLYAIAKYGGIYLDTDVMVYKSFDPLLKNSAFIGREGSLHLEGMDTVNYLTTCCFGAEKGNEFISRCLSYYDERHFITSTDTTLPADLRLDTKLNSEVFTHIAAQMGYKPSVLQNLEQRCGDCLTVYPSSHFDSNGSDPEAYSVHLALGTWRENNRTEWTYDWKYKISWRIWALFERIAAKFNRRIIKLN